MRLLVLSVCIFWAHAVYADDYRKIDGADIYVTPDRWAGKKVQLNVRAAMHAGRNVRFVVGDNVTIFAEPTALSEGQLKHLEDGCGTVREATNNRRCRGPAKFNLLDCKMEDRPLDHYVHRVVCIAEKVALGKDEQKLRPTRR